MENNKSMKKKVILNYPNLLRFLITIISLWLLIFFIRQDAFNYKFMAAAALLALTWLPFGVEKLFKIKIPVVIILVYFYFLILSLIGGVIFGLYIIFPWYDDFNHFLAGGLLTLLGIYIVSKLDNIGYLKFSLVVTYALFFAGFCAGIWEVSEFIISRIFAFDIQRVDVTGVNDTIIDIIMSFLGSAVILTLLFIDNKLYDNKYLEKLLKKFGD